MEDQTFEENLGKDIEPEAGNEEVVIKVPFNPTTIKVDTRPYSIGQIISDLQDGVIDFDTEFQRLPDLWDAQKKSRFIESLLLNLPVPAFYFNEKEENDWEVVDGLQRVSTLRQFVIYNSLRLVNLEFLGTYNGLTFSDLPVTLQKRITRFPITLYLVEKGTPDDVKYNIFKRINQGGLVLTPQEIRHAINQGKPAEIIGDMVRGEDILNPDGTVRVRRNRDGSQTILLATLEGKIFRKVTEKKIPSIRMEDRDFATRFVAFYLIPYTSYEPDLDSFLNKGMAKLRDLTENDIQRLKASFVRALDLAFDIFGNDSFRKRLSISDHRKPINKALFEVLSVSFAQLNEEEISVLRFKKDIFRRKIVELQSEKDSKFLSAITQGTARKENVEQRFTDIKNIIAYILTNDQVN
ncbi:DUF262 domain-containing protein [Dyadobacter sp. CY343]|uniref:GmrSD restriction endonuclease domain-containing protein n=1 Tax=Dyadobacter sp. CY343 TaxID=2907299 RepID=UPI001F28B723|nr:DUF262 domain-containing protein [Dyadobacter sp. CY343]MCE7060661.1 DUF262 domain-containing protein [Dyadobacter sp. CY343]